MDALRDQRGLPWLENVARDVRYGLRVLRRSPVFTTVAVLSLALGIGANAAIFHLIDNVRLRSLPVPNPRELAEIRLDGPDAFGIYDGVYARATYPLWEQIRSHQEAFSGVFAWGNAQLIVGRGSEARPARGLWASGELFPVLGLVAARGRLLAAADDRPGCGAQAAVISYGFWQSHFGGAESVVGQAVTVLEQTFTIVGVAPPAFSGLEVGQTFDVALPLCSAELFGYRLEQRDRWWLTVMGRLRPDWTVARANDHMRALSPDVLDATVPLDYEKALTDAYRGLHFGVLPAGRGVSRLRDAYGPSLLLLLGLTGLVLLITCGNLATLMLARATARHREIAVRAAIGASRARLVSQMACESVLVAIAGALLAVPAAVLAGRTLVAFFGTPANPVSLSLTADWRLIAFIGSTAILSAIAFGIIPAWRVSVVQPMSALVSRGVTVDRFRARFQRGLVAAQVAVSLVLMVSALMFVQTFRNLATVETGFEQDGTMAVWFFDLAAGALAVEQKVAFQEQLTSAIRAVPGVVAAASSTHVPLSGGTWSHFFRIPGAAQDERKASRFAYVDGAYFDTLKIPVRAGRSFTALDTARSLRVTVVNESFARSHFGGLNPVGMRIRTAVEADFPETTYEIVGVVGDTKYGDLRDEDCWCEAGSVVMPPIAYVPIAQNPRPYAWSPVMVRVAPGASGVTPAIAAQVARLNPGIVVEFTDLEVVRRAATHQRTDYGVAGRRVRPARDRPRHRRALRSHCLSCRRAPERDRRSTVARLNARADHASRAARLHVDAGDRRPHRPAHRRGCDPHGGRAVVWPVRHRRTDSRRCHGAAGGRCGARRQHPGEAGIAARSARRAQSGIGEQKSKGKVNGQRWEARRCAVFANGFIVCGATLRPGRRDEDLAEELRLHAALAAESGRRESGSAQAMDALRDQRGLPWLDDFVRDVRIGARMLLRSKGFTATALISLALGIGANAGIFSLFDQVLARPLPVREPERLVQLRWVGNPVNLNYGFGSLVSYPLCRDLGEQRDVFEALACRYPTSVNVSTGGEHVPVRAELVSGSYFQAFGVVPMQGRLIGPDDDREPGLHPVVVLSHDYWMSSLGAADVVGRRILINKQPMTIIGIAPETFSGAALERPPAVWIPTMMQPQVTPEINGQSPRAFWIHAIGRLAPGVSVEQARARLQPRFKQILAGGHAARGFPASQ